MNVEIVSKPWNALWLATALFVVAWRALALFHPHSAATDPPMVQRAMAIMGLWFLGCGLIAAVRGRGTAASLFAGYGVTAALHWGGPIGVGPAAAQNLEIAFYIVVSSLLAQSLFLHVALAFPEPLLTRRRWLIAVYAPPLAGGVLLLVLLANPESGSVLGLLPLLILGATLCSVAAAIVWFVRTVRAEPAQRRQQKLALVTVAIVVGWLPYLFVSLGWDPWPGYGGLFNLPMALVPTAITLALLSDRGAAP